MAARRLDDGISAENWAEVYDELDRLPEKYRAAIVLCDLESLTQEEAAAQLRQPARTFRRRLAEGRELLRARLTRRGLIHAAGSLSSGLAPAATRGPVAIAWADTTVRAAMRVASGQATTLVISARVAAWVEGVITTMFWTKLKVAMAFLLTLGLIGTGLGLFARNLGEPSDGQSSQTQTPAPAVRTVAVPTDPKQVVGRISDRIKANYARLRTVRVILQGTSLDRSVTKREEVTIRSPDGGTIQFVREPFSVRRERVLLRGDDVFREVLEEDGGFWAFHRGVWTQYAPKTEAAWRLRTPEQMPGMPPLDPRNIASMEQRYIFVDRLRRDRVLEIGPTRTVDGQPRVGALMEHDFEEGGKERYRCEFDPARNDLPTRIVLRPGDDKIGIIVVDITYQEVIPGAAWFLKKATCKCFDPARRDHRTQRRGGRPTSSRRRGRYTSTSRSPTMRLRSRFRVARESPMRSRARRRKAARILRLGKERPCACRLSPAAV